MSSQVLDQGYYINMGTLICSKCNQSVRKVQIDARPHRPLRSLWKLWMLPKLYCVATDKAAQELDLLKYYFDCIDADYCCAYCNQIDIVETLLLFNSP